MFKDIIIDKLLSIKMNKDIEEFDLLLDHININNYITIIEVLIFFQDKYKKEIYIKLLDIVIPKYPIEYLENYLKYLNTNSIEYISIENYLLFGNNFLK